MSNKPKVPALPLRLKTIDLGGGSVLRVEIDQFKGKETLNIRIWQVNSDGDRPTKKGINLPRLLAIKVDRAMRKGLRRWPNITTSTADKRSRK